MKKMLNRIKRRFNLIFQSIFGGFFSSIGGQLRKGTDYYDRTSKKD